MEYSEITVRTTTFGSDLVSAIMWEYTDSGVVIFDPNDVAELIRQNKCSWDYIDDKAVFKNTETLVKAYVPKERFEKVYAALLDDLDALKRNAECDVGSLETSYGSVDGDEWREKWKERFMPVHEGKIVICPEWVDYKPLENEIKIVMDSNMAFGTGEHETTRMCLKFIGENVSNCGTFIDVGCGSGILGIAAKKCGAREVIMTDIDECAVRAAKHNAEINGVADCSVLNENLLDGTAVKGDMIACNIMAEVLISFAPKLVKHLNINGKTVLSGILNGKARTVREAYEKAGFSLLETQSRGEWTAMLFTLAK